jgi:hypothetical protein
MQADPSLLFIPADPELQQVAIEIETEMRRQLTDKDPQADRYGEGDGSDLQANTFLPLDARVRAAETVMSGLRFNDPDQAAAVDTMSRSLGISAEEVLARLGVSSEPILPALSGETEFERRERLRRERKRLVGILHHRAGRDYQEIQQWVNEVVAAGRPITEHTLAELEQAIRLLTRELSRPAGGRGAQAA